MAGFLERMVGPKPRPVPGPPPKLKGASLGPPAPTDADVYFNRLMQRLSEASAPQEGMTRLYRVGDTATDYVLPETKSWFGQVVPYEEYQRMRELHYKRPGSAMDTNPRGAAGRWFTDAPNELDYYIRKELPENSPFSLRSYYRDVPTSRLMEFNVGPEGGMSQFKKNSKNSAREFVLPIDEVREAQEVMQFMGPLSGLGR